MADKNETNPLNVPGRFYTDLNCIDCDLCREIAPQTFRRDDEEGLTYVWKQPVTSEEVKLAEEAFNCCPVETIGDDR